MLDHAHFWPLVSEKCWSEGRWWPIRASWWWIITNRRCRWHFTLFCDEEESPSARWSNRLNKGALKAAVSLEEPVDLPRSRSSWKLEDREELQALNSRFEPAGATHSFSTSYCFSEETIEYVTHRTLCTLLRNWGRGGGSGVALKRFLCDPCLYVCFQLLISGGPSAPHVMFHSDGCHVSRKRLLLCWFVHFNYWCNQPTAHTCCRTTALDVVAGDAVVSMLCFSTQDWLFAPWHWSRGELCEWVRGFFFFYVVTFKKQM